MDNAQETFSQDNPVGMTDPALDVQTPDGDISTEENLLLGKFKSPDDLAQSYQELERKLSDQAEYAKLGRAVDEIGTDAVEDFINNRREFEQWRAAQAGQPAATGSSDLNPKEFWEQAANDPKGAMSGLLGPEIQKQIQAAMEYQMGQIQQGQRQVQEDLAWTKMRQTPGFTDDEKDFVDWYQNTPADLPSLYEVFRAQKAGREHLERARREKAANRRAATTVGGDSITAPTDMKLPRPKNYEEAKQNALKMIENGVRFNV